MLLSLGLALLMGLSFAWLCKKMNLPSLVGFILTGILLGPYILDLMDDSLMGISKDLRTISLLIILLRAGLSLDIQKLLKQGKTALFLTFVPATFEILGTLLFTQYVFGWSWMDGFILGTILAAVSPAVIVPRMIQLIESHLGTKRGIPQMIMAGASADDIYVILLFTVGLALKQTNSFDFRVVAWLPIEILLGALYGFLLGKVLVILFQKYHMRDTIKVLIIIGLSLVLYALENYHYSGLIAVVSMALTIHQVYPVLANRLVKKYEKIWVFMEMLLFILIGALLDITIIPKIIVPGLSLIGFVLVFRLLGVYISTSKSNITIKEKHFMALSYIPKATVQASIGAIPLALGLSHGVEILGIAVIAILVTAPFGAFLIDQAKTHLLTYENRS
ncbi:cation:proton antiporter [Acholeplasma vituli]|uniref:Cation:proton antiporter n=1 Tax=Paracholeplasma vituli TaxID=69473 RepID=A0ABT2PYG6_9MOLU|nr:cation:proton antiporter [Paracholeplasma vituli]MCU0105526.1 cation:proton antiporter [Paracholeplasma vituli]